MPTQTSKTSKDENESGVGSIKGWLIDRDTLEQSSAAAARGATYATTSSSATYEETYRRVSEAVGTGSDGNKRGMPAVVGRPVKMTSDVFADVDMYASQQQQQNVEKSADVNVNANANAGSQDQGPGVDVGDSLTSATVFGAVDNSATQGGSLFLRRLTEVPIWNADTLNARRETILTTRNALARPNEEQPVGAIASKSTTTIAAMRDLEQDVLWAYAERDDEDAAALYDMAYFKTWFMRSLNGCPAALTALNAYRIVASPLIGILSPVLYFVVPYMILRYKATELRALAAQLRLPLNIPATFGEYLRHVYSSFTASEPYMESLPSSMKWTKYVSCGLSLLFYFQAMFNSVEISRTLCVVTRMLNARITRVWRFLARAASVVNAYWQDGIRDAFFSDVESAEQLRDVTSDFTPEDETEAVDFGATYNIGEGLSRYRLFDHARFARLLRTYYAVDAVMAAARLARRPSFCVASFLSQQQPSVVTGGRLLLRGVWHPCIRHDRAVPNDVEVDHAVTTRARSNYNNNNNMLITGPNAGGKSTLIKSVVIAALLAQTLTVCPCAGSGSSGSGSDSSSGSGTANSGADITPFAFINSQINVPDVKGKRSLFEEEMYRARSNLQAVRDTLSAGQTALVVIDEIFSSTNPVEGIAGGYAVAKHLALHPNCVTVISTHFSYLCRLACERRPRGDGDGGERQQQQGARLFRNYQMPVRDTAIEDDDGLKQQRFVYPYRLQRGVCRQFIALELLKTHGFDDDVINDAIDIKDGLQHKTGSSPLRSSQSPKSPDLKTDDDDSKQTDKAAKAAKAAETVETVETVDIHSS